MAVDPPRYIDLSMPELREVTRFAALNAADVLPLFERTHPGDTRPRAALDAARQFFEGEPRSRLQRVTALDAHRAARDADTQAGGHAAHSAAAAAAAAYLHPLASADQVGHILRSAAHAAAAAELAADDPEAAVAQLDRAVTRATPVLIEVLLRYPPARPGRTRVPVLMRRLDTRLRAMR
ncbi:hypothetical protein FHR72_004687 [Mycolicibacterium iranicum]|uniref:Imm-5-like domain-containing protein n=1 Tax=Mycolicibacterium iranicum TaxID=912594 RepID=A0A839QB52_MYCIR|nr:hypothetical protein [Mycolicibacterium iranicum]